jgi:sec-independent protein translocase protein TatA
MGAWGIQHWLIVLVVVLVLFGGRGKISSLMGDFAQGIKSFKKGMADDDVAKVDPPKVVDQKPMNSTMSENTKAT